MSEAAAPSGSSSGAGLARVLSDDRLARRAVKGDDRAFAAIFRRYHQSLYRYCLGILGDSQDAQDALQNTMVKVLRALPGEERQIDLKPWLYRIAHNESIELVRRRRDTRQLDPELAASGSDLAEESAVRERLARLISDLEELPERQRGALVMRELSGLDFGEIAAALGTSPAVARQTLYEARLSLRQMDEGREMSCETVTRALSDGDGRVTRRRDVRAHLRTCASCRRFGEDIDGRERDLAALSPLPVAVAAGLLHGLLGGHGAGGGGLASALGASAALKGAATVAVVAALGVTAADRGGLIHVGLPVVGGSQSAQSQRSPGAGDGEGQPTQAADSPAAAGSAAAVSAGRLKGARGRATAPKAASSEPGKANAEATAVPAGQSSSSHPHGRGHAKELPAASAHGQQTAASHKAANHGSAGTKSHPVHPSKPSHTSKPSGGKGPSSPPPSGAEQGTHSQAGATPPAPGAEEASSGHEGGKKP